MRTENQHLAVQATRMNTPKSTTGITEPIIDKVLSYALVYLDAGDYTQAISCLHSLVESTNDWICRFWLATSYLDAEMNTHARHQFLYIAEHCPDADLRAAARNMLVMMCRTDAA